MRVALLVKGVLALLATLLVGAPAIYFGLAYATPEASVAPHRAVGIALFGALAWGFVTLFFGWIPVIGLVMLPVAWIGTIRWATATDWPAATLVGLTAWALTTLAYRGVGIAPV